MTTIYSEYTNFDKPFFIDRRKNTGTFNMTRNHYHNAFEIYYLVEGERYYFIEDKTYHIQKGDLVLININELHKTIDAGSTIWERILINFKDDYLYGILTELPEVDLLSCFHKKIHTLRLDFDEQTFVQTLLSKMLVENKKNEPESTAYTKALLVELLIFILRYVKQNSNVQAEHTSPANEKISEVVSFINQHYTQKITLELLSDQFYLSSYYLSRLFKKVTGFSFIEYLNNIRTREACRLLEESKLNITQISELIGYESVTHFGRVFKSIKGMSPMKYRKSEMQRKF